MKIMLDKKDIRPIYASRICSPRRKSKTSSSRARISHTPTRPHFPADPPHYFKMSTATVTILYPAVAAGSDVKLFNMDYYLNTHMAMVQAQWTAYGLLGWQVGKLDEASGYSVQCTMSWTDIASAKKAMSESAQIMTDGPNYSTVKSIALFGDVVGESVKA